MAKCKKSIALFEPLILEKDKLSIEFNQIRNKFTSSNLIKGEELEDLLARNLANVINCSIGKGLVINGKGNASNQCDLILYENEFLKFPSIIKNNVFPVELVYGIIEVKTYLRKKDLEDSLDKIIRFKKIVFEAFPETIPGNGIEYKINDKAFGIIFAYDGCSLDNIVKNYKFLRKSEHYNWPNLIYILSKGLIFNTTEDGYIMSIDDILQNRYEHIKIYKENDHYRLFIAFLLDLLNVLEISFKSRVMNITSTYLYKKSGS